MTTCSWTFENYFSLTASTPHLGHDKVGIQRKELQEQSQKQKWIFLVVLTVLNRK